MLQRSLIRGDDHHRPIQFQTADLFEHGPHRRRPDSPPACDGPIGVCSYESSSAQRRPASSPAWYASGARVGSIRFLPNLGASSAVGISTETLLPAARSAATSRSNMFSAWE